MVTICPECQGEGWVEIKYYKMRYVSCGVCGGSGMIRWEDAS